MTAGSDFSEHVPEPRANMSPFDYAREQTEAVRKDFKEKFDHESRYRKQYGEMAAEAMAALSEKGWVTLTLATMTNDIKDMKRGQNRIFITAFSLLITMLTLLVTIIFGVLTRG